jgi:two-component system, OmpR family, sensor histidine kinase BaeS
VRLRSRITVATLLVAIPLLAVVAWLRTLFMEQASSDALAHGVVELMQQGGREACERAPATWQPRPMSPIPRPSGTPRGDAPIVFPLPPPGGDERRAGRVGTYAYDASFVSSNPRAPRIDAELREQLARESIATRRIPGEPPLIEVVVRMAWRDGPCAMILIRRPDFRNDESWWELLPIRVWLPVLVLVILAVGVGIGPTVRRILRLTAEVRIAASESYQRDHISIRGTDEIGDLARAFSEAGREIRLRMAAQERRERTLREFLDNTTHDVMTPLTVLQGHLAALASSATPDQLVRVRAAMDEAHYMASLVHNLELAAKLEAGEAARVRDALDLDALVDRVVARHQPIARNHAVSLERATAEPPLLVAADVTFVEQAVSNLVLNAIQYAGPGGHVAIIADRDQATGRFVLRIVDDGPGMSAADLGRLLERGLRGNQARTRAPNGRGLGLDIVHRVVRLHGWELTLQSRAPRGLEVAIAGPLAPA